jgi:hypothetical protein
MSVLRLAFAFLFSVLFSGPLLLVPNQAEAACCACDRPCKITCTCCYGCNSGPTSNESLTIASSDTWTGAGIGGSSLFHAVSKLDFTDKWQHFMRGSQCVRDKVILRLLGAPDRRLRESEPVGLLDRGGMFR